MSVSKGMSYIFYVTSSKVNKTYFSRGSFQCSSFNAVLVAGEADISGLFAVTAKSNRFVTMKWVPCSAALLIDPVWLLCGTLSLKLCFFALDYCGAEHSGR